MVGFLRLPPVLRVASLLGLLCPLGAFAGFALAITAGLWFPGSWVARSFSVAVIAVNLGVLGLGCSGVVHIYNSRFRQPGGDSLPLETWQSQVRIILALAAIPGCASVLALVIPPTASAFQFVFPVSLVGIFVCAVALLVMRAG